MYQAQSFDHLRSLAGMSDGQIAEHLELYAGYVKQVNELTKELAERHKEKKTSGKDFGLAEATRRRLPVGVRAAGRRGAGAPPAESRLRS